MPTYVAFLRAINVGGHTVKMEHLRSLFEKMGFSAVETFIASGNVIFNTKSRNLKNLERNIETFLHEQLGYEVAAFLRSISDLAQIASYKPFAEHELTNTGNTLYVGFLTTSPTEGARQKLQSFTNAIYDCHISGREVYLLRRGNLGNSEFSGALIEKTLGMRATLRNANTVRKIAAKYTRVD